MIKKKRIIRSALLSIIYNIILFMMLENREFSFISFKNFVIYLMLFIMTYTIVFFDIKSFLKKKVSRS